MNAASGQASGPSGRWCSPSPKRSHASAIAATATTRVERQQEVRLRRADVHREARRHARKRRHREQPGEAHHDGRAGRRRDRTQNGGSRGEPVVAVRGEIDRQAEPADRPGGEPGDAGVAPRRHDQQREADRSESAEHLRGGRAHATDHDRGLRRVTHGGDVQVVDARLLRCTEMERPARRRARPAVEAPGDDRRVRGHTDREAPAGRDHHPRAPEGDVADLRDREAEQGRAVAGGVLRLDRQHVPAGRQGPARAREEPVPDERARSLLPAGEDHLPAAQEQDRVPRLAECVVDPEDVGVPVAVGRDDRELRVRHMDDGRLRVEPEVARQRDRAVRAAAASRPAGRRRPAPRCRRASTRPRRDPPSVSGRRSGRRAGSRPSARDCRRSRHRSARAVARGTRRSRQASPCRSARSPG